jgi:hypothetical protein
VAGKGLAGVSKSSSEVRAAGGGGPTWKMLLGWAGELQQLRATRSEPRFWRRKSEAAGGGELELGVTMARVGLGVRARGRAGLL